MPRKPKLEKTQITLVVRGTPVPVTLYPPIAPRTSWYAYWPGLTFAKTTGQEALEAAITVAEDMVRNGGRRGRLEDTVLSDEEFEEIQRVHYRKKQAPAARTRAEKSLGVCLDAIAAFREITGLKPVALANPDDCAAFQQRALELPKSHRLKYPKARRDGVECYSADTVLKWSRALQAAFERANINGGKKCVRGVVDNSRLLTSNPWRSFTWIEGVDPSIRQFTAEELGSILDYFEEKWEGVTAAALAIKVCFWTWTRLSELTTLKWDQVHVVGAETHLEIVGKWGVEKWARVPQGLHDELCSAKTDSDYIFAAYNAQLRHHYQRADEQVFASKVGATFVPRAFADWLQERIPAWAEATGREHATPHAFRRTALQYARVGEDINKQVADDAKLNTSVMLKHYVTEREEQLRQASNRTYHRIVAALPPEVARRYGYVPENGKGYLQVALEAATQAQDWPLVAQLAADLARQPQAN